MLWAVLVSSLWCLWAASIHPPQELDTGSYRLSFDGELSGNEAGAARFAADKKVDGQQVFVVHLLTPALEGGFFLVFNGGSGNERPLAGTYASSPAELKGMGGYQKLDIEPGTVAVLYYEMERDRMVLFGSTGHGHVEILDGGETVRGNLDIEISGAMGNPNAFLGVRPKRAMILGAFDASEGKVEFRKP